DALGDHAVLDDLPFLITHLIHQRGDPVAAEHPHQVVFQRHIELRSTGIPLAGRTASQLPVDAPAFMPFGTDDRQTARLFYTGAQFDIRSPTRHIGGDRYRSRETGFGDD